MSASAENCGYIRTDIDGNTEEQLLALVDQHRAEIEANGRVIVGVDMAPELIVSVLVEWPWRLRRQADRASRILGVPVRAFCYKRIKPSNFIGNGAPARPYTCLSMTGI